MRIEWRKVKLGDVGVVSRGKSKHRPRNDQNLYGGQYPFLQTSDIKNANYFVDSFSQTYNEIGLKQSKLWDKGTLCITIAANIAESAVLAFPACFPDSIVGFIPYKGMSDTRFMKYVLDNYKVEFQKRSKGATQDNLSVEKLNSLLLNIPNYEYQVKVSNIIRNYDDLIENNEKRIKILEEMAQRLYTQWFVKFEFPGHKKIKMVESGTEYGMIPEGWEVRKIGACLEVIPKKQQIKTNEYLAKGKYPIVDQGSNFISGYTDNDEAVYDEDLIVFGDHTRCFKYCNFHFARGADGTQLLKSGDSKRIPEILLYFLVKNVGLKDYKYARHFKFLKALHIIIPKENISNDFQFSVNHLYKLIHRYNTQNDNLIKFRDILIENLITGKRLLI